MATSLRSKSLALFAAIAVIAALGLAYYFSGSEENSHTREEDSISGHIVKEPREDPVDIAVTRPVISEFEPQVIKQDNRTESPVEYVSQPEEPVTQKEVKPITTPFTNDPTVRAQEIIKIDPPMREIGQAWLDNQDRNNFFMPVTDGRDLQINVERFESIGDQAGVFIGSVDGIPGSTVKLSYRGRAEAGTIDIPSEKRSYRILPGKEGSVIVQDRELSSESSTGAAPPVNFEIPPVPNFTPPPPTPEMLEKIPRDFN